MQLDDSLISWTRRPRTKKRRIMKKWRARKQNWTPFKKLCGVWLMGGAHSGVPAPTYDADGLPIPTSYRMHPAAFAKLPQDTRDKFEIVPLL